MTCNTRVLWQERKRRGSGAPYQKAVRWYHSGFAPEAIPEAERDQLVVCDGPVVATIAAVDEPDYGGTYAVLEIGYKCGKCGASVFPHLPQDAESLSRFVTDAIQEIRR
jgi:hypothetical protein